MIYIVIFFLRITLKTPRPSKQIVAGSGTADEVNEAVAVNPSLLPGKSALLAKAKENSSSESVPGVIPIPEMVTFSPKNSSAREVNVIYITAFKTNG